ncbi:NAD(P)-binding domain-containing protein [Glycomyces sp. TRM65418]|uniref:NAD(P)-dependent oxidoreductase n=1 Tax=Glycomyces sp. TRM65418 TaxID=2867006 RepID=UPI001CE59B71|nr:NAD(P)-binding domain-containing protein [Glycomyces sp. TRM65418]MCC3765230.1 NAD(P)-binding domain-containing protein [Glycomyces sp. TRM65418]QZD54854.1 NAD(P)-binding domain-containing protein [Glycomyces sp. TRM65418]
MSAKNSVTVIGLGPMGRSMVKAFLDAGVEVTVWNRTAAKADAMVELGAKRAATVAEALDANEVTVVSLTHYQAMYDVLGQATDHLKGKVIANLSSDSPENTRKGAEWALGHGARYLVGGFMSQGDDIAHPDSYLYFSGPQDLFDAHKDLLRPLSRQEYLGEDYGLAQVFYQAELALFHAFLIGWEQALAIVDRSGADIDRFVANASSHPNSYRDFMREFAEAAKAGGWGDLHSFKMMHAGAQHVIEASVDVGVDASLTETAQDFYQRAIDASERAGRPVPVYQLLRGTDA